MSEENVEVVARLVDAWNQANVEAMLALFDPECEVILPPEVPEPGPFHGHTELREWAEGFLAAWESHHAEVVELIKAHHSIVAILQMIGRGSGSGIEMDETDAHVFTFSDGKVTALEELQRPLRSPRSRRAVGADDRCVGREALARQWAMAGIPDSWRLAGQRCDASLAVGSQTREED